MGQFQSGGNYFACSCASCMRQTKVASWESEPVDCIAIGLKTLFIFYPTIRHLLCNVQFCQPYRCAPGIIKASLLEFCINPIFLHLKNASPFMRHHFTHAKLKIHTNTVATTGFLRIKWYVTCMYRVISWVSVFALILMLIVYALYESAAVAACTKIIKLN